MDQNRPEGHEIGVGARMGLHIGVVRAEKPLCLLDGLALDCIDIIAAGVKTVVDISFAIFVREQISHRELDGQRAEIFRGDQFEIGTLVSQFLDDASAISGKAASTVSRAA